VGGDDVGAQLQQEAGDGRHDARPVRAGDQQARGVAGLVLRLGGPCGLRPSGHLGVRIARHALPSEPYFFPVLEVCPGVLEVSPAAGVDDDVTPAFGVVVALLVGVAGAVVGATPSYPPLPFDLTV
jgi:hypothetical protein